MPIMIYPTHVDGVSGPWSYVRSKLLEDIVVANSLPFCLPRVLTRHASAKRFSGHVARHPERVVHARLQVDGFSPYLEHKTVGAM
jgi:hypothetical protein